MSVGGSPWPQAGSGGGGGGGGGGISLTQVSGATSVIPAGTNAALDIPGFFNLARIVGVASTEIGGVGATSVDVRIYTSKAARDADLSGGGFGGLGVVGFWNPSATPIAYGPEADATGMIFKPSHLYEDADVLTTLWVAVFNYDGSNSTQIRVKVLAYPVTFT